MLCQAIVFYERQFHYQSRPKKRERWQLFHTYQSPAAVRIRFNIYFLTEILQFRFIVTILILICFALNHLPSDRFWSVPLNLTAHRVRSQFTYLLQNWTDCIKHIGGPFDALPC
jgi:hypothetical protein